MSEERTGTGLTVLGKLLTIVLIAGLIAGGFYLIKSRGVKTPGGGKPTVDAKAGDGSHGAGEARTPAGEADAKEAAPAELKTEVPRLAPAGPYQPKDNTVDVELSEYAGYAGLIAANGGLEPNENSVFFKKHGFKVRLALSEEESWSKLNSGGMAASATTVDVLAVYGRQFQVNVPALIGFSRGADGVVVRKDIKSINQLRGKVLATSQFTEAEFFIRYLAQEAGIPVVAIADLNAKPSPDKVNLVFADDAFAAGDLFLQDVTKGTNKLAGCVTWAPKTTEVADGSGGRAHVLITNKNLLIVADILIVNRGFAQANPKMAAGLVDGLMEGNRMVRDNAAAHLDVIARAFKWDAAEAKEELAKVHLANLPENQAFFSGAIDAAGSFGGIYQAAVYAYGNELIPNPAPPDRFVEPAHLKTLEASGQYKDQKVAIAPIRSGSGSAALETGPLLSKDIRFLFKPDSFELDLSNQENLDNLGKIKDLLRVSPGSMVFLRGHVDDRNKESFRQKGPETLRKMAMVAMQLSQNRANEIKRLLVERQGADATRIDTLGRGWEEPVSSEPDPEKRSQMNRRVEVQWFTVE